MIFLTGQSIGVAADHSKKHHADRIGGQRSEVLTSHVEQIPAFLRCASENRDGGFSGDVLKEFLFKMALP